MYAITQLTSGRFAGFAGVHLLLLSYIILTSPGVRSYTSDLGARARPKSAFRGHFKVKTVPNKVQHTMHPMRRPYGAQENSFDKEINGILGVVGPMLFILSATLVMIPFVFPALPLVLYFDNMQNGTQAYATRAPAKHLGEREDGAAAPVPSA